MTIDRNGYPTEDTLSRMEHLNPFETDVYELVEYICENWVNGFDPEFNRETGCLKLSTGGWSGCESVIEHLKKSTFWLLYWYQTRRGGHYQFKVHSMKKDGSI